MRTSLKCFKRPPSPDPAIFSSGKKTTSETPFVEQGSPTVRVWITLYVSVLCLGLFLDTRDNVLQRRIHVLQSKEVSTTQTSNNVLFVNSKYYKC